MSSTTIDEKVVSIQFDNAKFERNVSTTMSTLDKLKQKLNFDGASKGMQDISNAASKMDFKPMSSAIETVGVKFNGLWTIADQTLRNITNSVESTAKRMIAAFTTDPIKTGFNEYELKMGSVQTIMASTGESLETVNQYLEELNKYSDKTIYSFSDMTQNIGKFTNAGVKLEDAVAAIKGISNEAAVSGANANEASRAMYNFSQALSAGYVKLIDWKSIENANMATVEFKETLLEAAVAAGTVEKTSDGMYKVLTKNNNGSTMDQAISATKNFNDSLGYQWMTTDALVTALEIYATDVRDMTDAEIEAYRVRLRNKGYTEEQIKAAEELGIKAANAATEVKTFTMLMDTLKEAAQSGWAQTWELIVGDFNEAKKLWTEVNEVLGGLIETMSNNRNEFLGGALNSNWEKFTKEINKAELSTETYLEAVRETAKEFGKTDEEIDLLIEKHGSLGKAIEAGAFETKILTVALNKVKKSMIDLSDVTEDLKQGATGDDVKKIQEALKKAGFQCGEFGEALDGVDGKFGKVTESAVKAFQEANGLEVTGIVDEKTLRALEKASGFTGELTDNMYKLIAEMDKLGGRELLIRSIKNAFKAVSKVLGTVKKAWDNAFGQTTTDKRSKQLYNIIEKIHEFTNGFSSIDDHLHKVQNTFEGFFSAVKFVKDVLVTVTSAGLKLGWNVFKPLAKIVLTVASAIGELATKLFSTSSDALEPFGDMLEVIVDVVSKFADFIGDNFTKAIDHISEFATSAIEHFTKATDTVKKTFGEWKKAMQETEVFQKISGYIETGAEAIRTAFDKIQGYIDRIDFSTITNKAEGISQFFINIGTAIGNSEFLVSIIDGIVGAFSALINFFDNVNFNVPSFDDVVNFFTGNFAKLVQFLTEKNYTGIFGTIKGVFAWLKSLLDKKITTAKNNVLSVFADVFNKIGDGVIAGIKKAKEMFAEIKEFIFGSDDVKLADIMSTVSKILGIVLLIESIKAARTVTGVVGGIANDITSGFNNLANSLKWRAIGDAFKSMAIAIGALAACILVLSQIKDMGKAWQAFAMVAGLIVFMGVAVAAMMKFSQNMSGIDMGTVVLTLLAFAGAIAILVWTLKTIDSTEFTNLGKSLGIMVSVMAALVLSIGILGKLCGGTVISAVGAIVTMLAAAKTIPEILQIYAEYPWSTVTRGIPPMIAVLGGLALVCRAMTVTAKEGGSIASSAGTILATVAALVVVVWAMKSLAEMPENDLWRSVKAVSALMAVLGIMAVAMKVASMRTLADGSVLNDTSNSFSGIATALLAVAASIYILGKMDVNTLKQGGIATVAILSVFTGMMVAIGKSGVGGNPLKGVLPMLIGMEVIIITMAVIVDKLSKTDWQSNIGAAGALGILLATMTGAIKALSKCDDVKWETIGKWAVTLGVFVLVMAVLSDVLRAMDSINPVGAIANATALSAILLAMTGCLRIISQKNTYSSASVIYDRLIAFAALSGVILILATCLMAMDGINPVGAIANATALSELLLVMSGCLYILSQKNVYSSAKTISDRMKAFAALSLVVLMLAVCLNAMNGIEPQKAIGNATALSALLLAMTGCMRILAGVSNVNAKALLDTVGVFAVFGLVTIFVASILGQLQAMNINGGQALGQVAALSTLLLGMSACILILSKIGTVGATVIWPALGALAAFATGLVVFLGALGEIEMLMDGGLSARLDNAIVIMQKVGEAMGALVGGVVGGVGMAISSTLPQLGKDLSEFMSNAQVFFDGLRNIDTGMLGKAALIAPIIGALEALALINGIANIFTLGRNLPVLGEDLGNFFIQGRPFFDGLATLNDSTLAAAKVLAETIMLLTASEFIEGISNLFGLGSSSFADFGTELAGFGASMKAFSDSVADLDEKDLAHIEMAATAGTKMAELEGAIPKKGGIWQNIMGESDLAAFGASLKAFGECLVKYAGSVETLTDKQKEAIGYSADAGNELATLAGKIPNEGGWAATIMGENDMATFGRRIVAFGESLVKYADAIVNLTPDDTKHIKSSAEAAMALATLAGTIPNEGGWAATIMGENDMATFGRSLVSFGVSLASYAGKVADLDDADVAAINKSKECVEALKSVAEIIPKTDNGWWGAIAGETNLAAFGTGMSAIAQSVKDCIAAANGITDDDIGENGPIARLKKAVQAMDDAANEITIVPGYRIDLDAFGTGMKTMSDCIVSCIASTKLITADDIAETGSIARFKTAINMIKNAIPTEFVDNTAAIGLTIRNIDGLAKMVSNMTSVDPSATEGFVAAVNNLGNISIDGLEKSISGASGKISDSFKQIITAGLSAINTQQPKFNTSGEQIMVAFIKGITSKASTVKTPILSAISSCISAVKQNWNGMYDAGKYLGAGLVSGINSKWQAAYDAGYALGQAAVQGEKDGQQSNSPSKATIKAGHWMGEGLVIGLKDMGKKVYNAGHNMGEKASDSISGALHTAMELLSGDMDSQPTIRPVLDLSDIRSGAGAINGMFSLQPSVGLLTNVGSINASMNRRNQNGANGDVVSAIDKLRKDIGGLQGNVYNIDGITYDDGSNIVDAVQTLVRAARQGGRV